MNENTQDEFINIAVLENSIEAQLLESILTEQHIPYQIRSYHDTAFDGLFQIQRGWGTIHAPSSQKAEILDILDSIRSGSQYIMDYDGNDEES